jgi:glycosyltransferase involved in cell wall biosynthesis
VSEALRVLFVVHNHPRIRPGGAEAYALELHRELNQTDGFSSTLLARAELGPGYRPGGMNPLPDAEDDLLFYTSEGSFDHFFGRSHARGATAARFSAFLAAYRPDVVHFQHTLFLGYDLVRATRTTLPGVPIVLTFHELLPICYHNGQMVRVRDGSLCMEASARRCSECFPQLSTGQFALRKRFIHRQLDCVDRFIAPSEFIRKRYVDWGIPFEKITVEEYGRRPMRETGDERIAPSRTILGFFGQITQFKGVDVLLRAMAILAERGSPAHLRLHGANLQMQVPAFQYEIARLLEKTRANVTVVGQYNHGQLAELMKLVDWVVVPSIWWENSPLVIQEAFGHRRPVICSNIGGMAEKVEDGVTGCHFRVGDPQSLAETIETAISDPGTWEAMQARITPPYEMGRHVERLSQIYDELIASSGVPA